MYLFIWLCWVLVVACGILIPDQAPYVGNVESQPLDHQGKPESSTLDG